MKNFRFKITKVYSKFPPPSTPKNENFRFKMPKVYSEIPTPKWKTSDLIDDQSLLWNTPPIKNFRFKITKVYSEIPLPNEKLQIWDDQTWLVWNTPPPTQIKNFRFKMTKVYSEIPPPPHIGSESGRSYVETNLYPPWIPLVFAVYTNTLLWLVALHTLDHRTLTLREY